MSFKNKHMIYVCIGNRALAELVGGMLHPPFKLHVCIFKTEISCPHGLSNKMFPCSRRSHRHMEPIQRCVGLAAERARNSPNVLESIPKT